jgi:hypothetical protein
MKIYIPQPVLDYAKHRAPNTTPINRTGGFIENNSHERGVGDLIDFLGTEMMFELLAEHRKQASKDITIGRGDQKDLTIWINKEAKFINIKNSLYEPNVYNPFPAKLHLNIKKEELTKNIDIYVQAFVHLNESRDNKPHVHIIGWCEKNDKVWNSYIKNISEIPNTNGHEGIRIPINKLRNIKELITLCDNGF